MIDQQNKYPNSVSYLILLFFVALSVAFFAPEFDRSFASDDYCSLSQVINGDGWLVHGFFRPVGDFTLWLNFQVSGWNSRAFYFTNAVIHGINAWLLYRVCMCVAEKFNIRGQAFAFSAALIFLSYHSLGEAVLWTIGRGVELAVTFSLLSLIIFFSELRERLKNTVSAFFYFAALCSYESALLLPAVFFVFSVVNRKKPKRFSWITYFVVAALLNVGLRFYFTGALWASYEGVVFGKTFAQYVFNFAKTGLRIVTPAVDNPLLFSLAGGVLIVITAICAYRVANREYGYARIIMITLSGIIAGLLMAMFYGVSTRTSEGDRLLYFPSLFFAMFVAALFVQIRSLALRRLVTVIILLIQFQFLSGTIKNWRVADIQATQLRDSLRAAGRPLYIVNLPSDYRGAYQYRNCFNKALLFHGVDTTGIRVINILKYPAGGISKGSLSPVVKSSSIQFPPEVTVEIANDRVTHFQHNGQKIEIKTPFPVSRLYYWDGRVLRQYSRKR